MTMKKLFVFVLILVSLSCFSVHGEEQQTAYPVNTTVLIDGAEVHFGTYKINDYHYFKLRDLAMALRGTDKGINMSWRHNSVYLYQSDSSSKEEDLYQPVGNELQPVSSELKTASPNLYQCTYNENKINFQTYNIDDYNYFQLRELAVIYDFAVEWNEQAERIEIDTTKGYTPAPYEAFLTEEPKTTGTVYDFATPVFVDRMPIITYYIENNTNPLSDFEKAWMLKFDPLTSVYVAVDDLELYGFDVYSDEKTIYIERNTRKIFGMLDGESVNQKARTQAIGTASSGDCYVLLDKEQISCCHFNGRVLIPVINLVKYCRGVTVIPTVAHSQALDPLDMYSFDFLKATLANEYEKLPNKKKMLAYNSENEVYYYGPNIENYAPFNVKIKGSFPEREPSGLCSVIIWDGFNQESTWYFGYLKNRSQAEDGPGYFQYTLNYSKFPSAYSNYHITCYGTFKDGELYDGVYHQMPQADLTVDSVFEIYNGVRKEGAMVNGYRRESVIYSDSYNNHISERNGRFGYVVQCEGEVKDGEYCGYFRKYDENGTLIFEGQYSDYLKTN